MVEAVDYSLPPVRQQVGDGEAAFTEVMAASGERRVGGSYDQAREFGWMNGQEPGPRFGFVQNGGQAYLCFRRRIR